MNARGNKCIYVDLDDEEVYIYINGGKRKI